MRLFHSWESRVYSECGLKEIRKAWIQYEYNVIMD